MFEISFNTCTIANLETEENAIGLALNLHQISNIPHNIVVTKEGEEVMYFIQR